jgi:hypothetical protein
MAFKETLHAQTFSLKLLIEKEENNLDTCIMFWGYEKAFNSIL